MTFKIIASNIALVKNHGNKPLISDVQSALDFIMTATHETNCTAVVIKKEDVTEDFFDLKSGIAGEILQKFVNYGFRIAIVGDFSCYKSKSLKDFIYESNKGTGFYFTDSVEKAVVRLSN